MRAIRAAFVVAVTVPIFTLTVAGSCGAGVVALYSLDNNTVSGTTVADVSGNHNDGTLLSGVTIGQQGKFGQAFSFSGADSEITASAPYVFGSRFSISLWLNTADLAQFQKYVLLHGTSGGNQNAIIFGYSPNKLQFY